MPQKCPACGVNNPPRAPSCTFCKFDFQKGIVPTQTFTLSTATVQPVEIALPASSDTLVLEAPYMRLRGLVGSAVMGVVLLPMLIVPWMRAPSMLVTLLIGWIVMVLLVPQLLMLIRPRRLVVQGDRFMVNGMLAVSTPASNLFLVAHDGMGLSVRFRHLEQVECKPGVRTVMEKASIKSGHHLHFPGFTYAQAKQLRDKVGLPAAPPSASLTRVRDYQQSIRQLTPRVWVTYLLVGINCIVYLLMVASGVHAIDPTTADLLQWGANFGPYTNDGQGWRLFTCCFLHIGIVHLFFNMWALLMVGPQMERLLGNVGFLILYIVAGLVGSIVSVWWHTLVVSAGASGAIFGIFGAMLGFLVLHKASMPSVIYRQVWSSGVALLVFNFVFAAGAPGIDAAAHFGGALAGFVAGMLLSQPLDEKTRGMRLWRNLLLLVLASAMITPAFFYLPKPQGPPAAWALMMIEFPPAEAAWLDKYNRAVERTREQELGTQALNAFVSEQLLPAWSGWMKRIESLEPQKPAEMAYKKTVLQYMQLRYDGWQLQNEAMETNDNEKMTQAAMKFKDAEKVLEGLKVQP